VVFVGSSSYHKEYPFRAKLVEWLHKKYGSRFGHYGGGGYGVVRGHELNTLMATAKVVVGDSCFGGRPNYVSDRYYETRGRGGFLIHPHVKGVDTEGVVHYSAGNLESLGYQIDSYLQDHLLRESLRRRGFMWVKGNETYTHRTKEVLERIGI
jgi:hypothetical protein